MVVKIYCAYLEDFKRFMHFFRDAYPELYDKYRTNICWPESGMNRAVIKKDSGLRPVTRLLLNHIINEFYIVRSN